MRIIAGQYRGRTLSTVRDLSVRPTTDRAKQTIFDILSNRLDFDGIEVLDLFAGSGSLGLEAVSRGAAHVTFVDKAQQTLRVLESNVTTLGCSDQCTAYTADVFWYLKNTRKAFDLVFVDPPYRLERIEELPNAIYESPIVKEGTYVVMEHSKESQVIVSDLMYDVTRKPFGQTTVLIMQVRAKTLQL
ncbi:MAG: 16S rRNA (guanine(966)-N(2))-methyltransferase RsmD [Ignavibacteriales bacterium]|nr:16S rRNA (guanine(966)-N(2))-methyltransferase RsmD [Ignavibacteriales bacterium]